VPGGGPGAKIASYKCNKYGGPTAPHIFHTFIVQSRPPDLLRTEFSQIFHFSYLLAYLGEWATTRISIQRSAPVLQNAEHGEVTLRTKRDRNGSRSLGREKVPLLASGGPVFRASSEGPTDKKQLVRLGCLLRGHPDDANKTWCGSVLCPLSSKQSIGCG
jgi:hypothetical protein